MRSSRALDDIGELITDLQNKQKFVWYTAIFTENGVHYTSENETIKKWIRKLEAIEKEIATEG